VYRYSSERGCCCFKEESLAVMTYHHFWENFQEWFLQVQWYLATFSSGSKPGKAWNLGLLGFGFRFNCLVKSVVTSFTFQIKDQTC